MKFARCAKCKEFDRPEKMVKLYCPSCLYVTYRHKDEDTCGGKDGALRSIRGHFTYFLKRAGGDGGHTVMVRRASRIILARVAANLKLKRG